MCTGSLIRMSALTEKQAGAGGWSVQDKLVWQCRFSRSQEISKASAELVGRSELPEFRNSRRVFR